MKFSTSRLIFQCFSFILIVKGNYELFYKRDCQYGKVLEGRVYKSFNSFPNPNPSECFFRCVRDCRCESFQFQQTSTNSSSHSVCQLNGIGSSINSSNTLVERQGFVFCELNFTPKNSKDCSCEVNCCNKNLDPCSKNGGKCIANCGPRPRYYCVCQDGHIGPDCLFKPKSCLEILKNDPNTVSGYYYIYMTDHMENKDHKDHRTRVYCDMAAYWNETWTLVQSFTFSNQHLFHFPFYISNISLHSADGWSKYRMSNAWMSFVKSQSTKWRATCNYTPQKVDKIDYVVAKFSSIDLLSKDTTPGCYSVEYINIREYQCANSRCTTWFSQQANENPHFAPKYGKLHNCTYQGPPEAPPNSTAFGNYNQVIKDFRCTSNASATTAFWFGGQL